MRLLIALLVLALPASAMAQADSIVPMNRIRAIVGDKPIMQSQIDRNYSIMLRDQAPPDSATAAQRKKDILDLLIEFAIIEHVATVEKVTLPDEAVEQEIDRVIREIRREFPDEQTFVTELKKNGFANLAEFRAYKEFELKQRELPRMVHQSLRSNRKLPSVVVPDSIIDRAIAQQRGNIGPKLATIGFRQLVVPTAPGEASKRAARARADSIEQLLQRGANFDSLARIVSMDSSTRAEGGNIGLRKRGGLDATFERWLFNLNPGLISPVFETPYGLHILKVDRREAAQVQGRHILIVPQTDSSDYLRAKARADSAAEKLRTGEPFDSVLARYNDAGANPSPTIPSYPRDSLPTDFANALKDKKVGDIVGPFAAHDATKQFPAFVIALVTNVAEGGTYSNEELREMMRTRVQDVLSLQEYYERVKKQIFIRIFD